MIEKNIVLLRHLTAIFFVCLVLAGCSRPVSISADFAKLLKSRDSIDVVAGGFGGGTAKKSKPLLQRKISFELLSAREVRVIFNDTTGAVDFSPQLAGLPQSWEGFNKLKMSLVNDNPFGVTLSFGIRGRWLRGMSEFELLPGEAKTISYPLEELTLIGSKESPFSPSLIGLEAKGKTKRWSLIIESLTLEQDKNLKPIAVADQFGQRKRGNWKGKITDEEMLRRSIQSEKEQKLDSILNRDRFGGCNGAKLKATGFFRYETVDGTWWFVTPEGNLFWSLGVTGVRPKNDKTDVTWVTGREFMFDYLPEKGGVFASAWVGNDRFSFYYLNLLRKYGKVESWRTRVLERLNLWGINTIGNWSEDSLLNQSEMPFTKSFDTKVAGYAAGHGVSDFFHPGWVAAVDTVLREALLFKDNKYLLGYFVDNEQGWGSGDFSGFLETLSDSAQSREVWIEMIQKKYKTIESLNRRRNTTFLSWEEVRLLRDRSIFPKLKEDIVAFEVAFASQYFGVVSSILKKYDPHHLYLGCRFTRQPKPMHIMQTAGKYCDVVTVNVYTFIPEELENWHNATQKPILIGEHHVPLSSERQFPPNYQCFPEEERKEYYLKYVEQWAKMPFSLGCHWYQFADQHLTGRSTDGECQTVGLVDITDQPYRHMVESVNKASAKIYEWHSK